MGWRTWLLCTLRQEKSWFHHIIQQGVHQAGHCVQWSIDLNVIPCMILSIGIPSCSLMKMLSLMVFESGRCCSIDPQRYNSHPGFVMTLVILFCLLSCCSTACDQHRYLYSFCLLVKDDDQLHLTIDGAPSANSSEILYKLKDRLNLIALIFSLRSLSCDQGSSL